MGVLGIANVLSSTYLYEETESSVLGKVLAFGIGICGVMYSAWANFIWWIN